MADKFRCQRIGDINGDGRVDQYCTRMSGSVQGSIHIDSIDEEIRLGGDGEAAKPGLCKGADRFRAFGTKFCYTGRGTKFYIFDTLFSIGDKLETPYGTEQATAVQISMIIKKGTSLFSVDLIVDHGAHVYHLETSKIPTNN